MLQQNKKLKRLQVTSLAEVSECASAENTSAESASAVCSQTLLNPTAMSSAGVGLLFSEVHSQCSHLPGNFIALPCFLLLISFFQQDLAPAHTAKGTKSWFNDHGVTVLR